MKAADEMFRAAYERRVRLALEARELGMTLDAIGDALGISNVAVSKWVRAANSR